MTRPTELDPTFDVLRELPVEVTVEQVGTMVATFTLAPPAASWLSHINLNSILMTSAGALIIAGTVYLFSPNDQQPSVRAQVPPTPPAVEMAATPPAAPGLPPANEAMVPIAPIPVIETTIPDREEVAAVPEMPEAALPQATPPTAPAPVIAAFAPPPGIAPLQFVPLSGDEGIAANGSTKEFDLTGFTSVKVLGAMDVILEQGDFAVMGEGPSVDRLEITVKDKTLVITTKNKDGQQGCISGESVTVRVKLPTLEGIELTGSGDVVIGEFTHTGDMDLGLRGSGDIHFAAFRGLANLSIALDGSGDIVGERLEVSGKTKINVAGSGDMRIAGRTDQIDVKVVGSGDVDASELEARACDAQVVGSGSVNVNCNGSFSGHATGSGAVNNTGNAGGGGSNGEGSHSN
ncbi:MAG: DUF2807 domain-containing protein [Flavobacteriales bacterium]